MYGASTYELMKSYRAENAGEKAEIACYEQFLFFPQYFQNTSTNNVFFQDLLFREVMIYIMVKEKLSKVDSNSNVFPQVKRVIRP